MNEQKSKKNDDILYLLVRRERSNDFVNLQSNLPEYYQIKKYPYYDFHTIILSPNQENIYQN